MEHEADRIADRVMRMPGPALDTLRNTLAIVDPHRACAACQPQEDRETLRARPVNARGVASAGNQAPPIVHEALRSPGQPLDPTTRAFFEPRFGHDFGQVRIHADAKAAESARAVNALAYTVGRDVILGENRYAPNTPAGQHLLAHELAHVVQQASHGPAQLSRQESDDGELAQTDTNQTDTNQPASDQTDTNLIATADLSASASVSSDGSTANSPLQSTTGTDAGGSCPSSEDLDAIKKHYNDIIQKGRDQGWTVAPDNLQHFLDGSGTKRILSVPWLRGFSSLVDAERANQKRFENSLNDEANKMKHGDHKTFNDYWDKMFTASQSEELFYASGTSTIRSRGSFNLTCIENIVSIVGNVQHHWFDPYDWHAGLTAYIPGMGNVSDADALALQNCRGAKPFDMESDWTQSLGGTITVGSLWNDKTFTWTGP